ncbi:MAG: PEGA domain-containing protein [Candidatus Delongbacteria bacterium]|nr:PEGA domain-containing protein [Candidatus Delongbacteria bacterium]MCG2760199.1 PEGA domain-containing protein [Candidatus Delongbacteria bacterium]
MMKKSILLILIAAGLLFSAEFKLVSYNADMMDMDARQSKITDDSGNRTGLLKIYSDQTGLQIQSNMGVVQTDKTHTGEFWAYLSQGEKWVKISKEGFAPFEFVLEPGIESDTVYLLKLQTISDGSVMGDLHKISFKFNVTGVYVAKGTAAPVLSSGKTSENWLAMGDHEFTFIKEGFVDNKEKISVTGDKEIDIELIPGSNQTKLKLPAIVSITSDPQGAEIFLNGQKFGMTPMQESLIAGEYSLTLRKNFYYPLDKSFTVKEGQTMEIPSIKLTPKFGYYSVKSDQKGVKLYLDGAYLAENSVAKTKIESGKHIFKAELDMYHTETQEIEFKDGDEKDIMFKMKPNFGKLIIKSEPSDAVIWLNGKQVGKTPYSIEQARSGKYVVKLTMELWSDYEDQVEVFDSKTTDKTLVMNKNFGTIVIKAKDCDIFVNGEKKGKSEFKGNLPPGKYTVTAKRAKHRDHEKEIYVNIGREQEIDLTPDPIMGSVNIFSEPIETNGAAILINDEEKGKTPAVIPLLIGDYKMKLTLSGYLDSSEQFTLSEGENKTIRLTMQTYEGSQSSKRDFWKKQKWYALGAFAVSAGAGSYFYWAGNDYYDQYENEPLTSSTAKVEGLREDAITMDKYRDVSFSVSLVPLYWFFHSWYKESSYK